MAYIIGEPIITYCGKIQSTHDIEVKFPVRDTLTEIVHYRGIRIGLDPQTLWMLDRDSTAPRWIPKLIPELVMDTNLSYAEILLKLEELQDKYKKKYIADGFDPDDEEKYRQWLKDLIPF